MSASEIPDESIDSSGREKIKEKLKLQFMNVRQNLRRNQLSTFLFGERWSIDIYLVIMQYFYFIILKRSNFERILDLEVGLENFADVFID